jgi:hypothetical protein
VAMETQSYLARAWRRVLGRRREHKNVSRGWPLAAWAQQSLTIPNSDTWHSEIFGDELAACGLETRRVQIHATMPIYLAALGTTVRPCPFAKLMLKDTGASPRAKELSMCASSRATAGRVRLHERAQLQQEGIVLQWHEKMGSIWFSKTCPMKLFNLQVFPFMFFIYYSEYSDVL